MRLAFSCIFSHFFFALIFFLRQLWCLVSILKPTKKFPPPPNNKLRKRQSPSPRSHFGCPTRPSAIKVKKAKREITGNIAKITKINGIGPEDTRKDIYCEKSPKMQKRDLESLLKHFWSIFSLLGKVCLNNSLPITRAQIINRRGLLFGGYARLYFFLYLHFLPLPFLFSSTYAVLINPSPHPI